MRFFLGSKTKETKTKPRKPRESQGKANASNQKMIGRTPAQLKMSSVFWTIEQMRTSTIPKALKGLLKALKGPYEALKGLIRPLRAL